MKKVLFIGGTKFIGAMLVDKFIEDNAEIYIFSRSEPKNDNVHFIQGDRNNIEDIEKLKSSIKDMVFDLVYDMCCYTPSQAEAIIDILSPHTKHLIFFSSAAVYAKTEHFPLNEGSKLGEHSSFGDYGTNKAAIEKIYTDACDNYNIRLTIFRPHYILGVGDYFMRHQYLFSRIEKGLDIDLPGNGEALVQFAYAPDVASLFHSVPEKQSTQLDIVNIATKEMMTLVGVTQLFANAAKSHGNVRNVDYEKYGLHEQSFYDNYFPFPNLNLVLDVNHAEKVYNHTGTRLETYIDILYKDWVNNAQGYKIVPTPFDKAPKPSLA